MVLGSFYHQGWHVFDVHSYPIGYMTSLARLLFRKRMGLDESASVTNGLYYSYL